MRSLVASDGGHAGRDLSSGTRQLATSMIENSDNDAATDLFDEAGSAAGLAAANRVFGLAQTTVDDAHWGETATTPDDQIRLLRTVLVGPSALSAASCPTTAPA